MKGEEDGLAWRLGVSRAGGGKGDCFWVGGRYSLFLRVTEYDGQASVKLDRISLEDGLERIVQGWLME